MSAHTSEHGTISPERPKKRSSGIPRSPNWCMSEIRVLCAYIRQHSSKILGSATDGPGRNAKKQKHWERVTRAINDRYGQNRVWKQVRKKWVDLTYMAKSFQKNNHVQDSGCATSDGSSDDENLTPVIKEVLSTLESRKHDEEQLCDQISSAGHLSLDNHITDDSSEGSNEGSPCIPADDTSGSESEKDDEFGFASADASSTTKVREKNIGQKSRKQLSMILNPPRKLRSNFNQISRVERTRPTQSSKEDSNVSSYQMTRDCGRVRKGHETRQRFGGAHRHFSPYSANRSSQNWRDRFSVVDSLVSRVTDQKINESESSFLRREMLDIERQKAATARAKLSLMQEGLQLRRQQLEVHKTMLFHLKNISTNIEGASLQKRHFQELHPSGSVDKYSSIWDQSHSMNSY